MRKKNYKGRCVKRDVNKCSDICRTYDPIQSAYADILANDDEISEFSCNVPMDGLSDGQYTSDFVCTKTDGSLMVRECAFRKLLTKPMTANNAIIHIMFNYFFNYCLYFRAFCKFR